MGHDVAVDNHITSACHVNCHSPLLVQVRHSITLGMKRCDVDNCESIFVNVWVAIIASHLVWRAVKQSVVNPYLKTYGPQSANLFCYGTSVIHHLWKALRCWAPVNHASRCCASVLVAILRLCVTVHDKTGDIVVAAWNCVNNATWIFKIINANASTILWPSCSDTSIPSSAPSPGPPWSVSTPAPRRSALNLNHRSHVAEPPK